jgi:ketosteroid isomerase-like protein
MNDLEKRIRRLEDREEIRNLVARYAFAVDNRDICAITSLLADEVSFRSKDGVMNAVGRDAVMSQFETRFAALGHGAHYSHDHVVWFDDASDDRACGLVSSHAELIRNGRPMITSLRYEDVYARERGRWVFADRLLSFFYYLNTDEYLKHFNQLQRMRANEQPQNADFPELLSIWREYHSKA